MTPSLRSCPYCGNKAETGLVDDVRACFVGPMGTVSCGRCGTTTRAEGDSVRNNMEDARRRWNALPRQEDNRMGETVCDNCRGRFTLFWDHHTPNGITLDIDSCLSGGVYRVRLVCPHCSHALELR